jgi:hypothetical protein
VGLEIEFSDFEAENATLKGDHLRQVFEIVIGGIPTFLEVHFMWLFMSLGKILLQGSISTSLFDPMRHQVDFRKVEVAASNFMETSISWLMRSRQVIISHRFLDGVKISEFISLSTFRFFTSSILRALALTFVMLPARLSKKTSLKV